MSRSRGLATPLIQRLLLARWRVVTEKVVRMAWSRVSGPSSPSPPATAALSVSLTLNWARRRLSWFRNRMRSLALQVHCPSLASRRAPGEAAGWAENARCQSSGSGPATCSRRAGRQGPSTRYRGADSR